MTERRLIATANSPAFLPEVSPLRRLPRSPSRPRSPNFAAAYEDRALVYDCFWHHDGRTILLVGPPPMSLAGQYRTARYIALPSREELVPRYFPSLSTMITALDGAPAGTAEVVLELDGTDHSLTVQPSHADAFAGRRVLFTMSKDNDLGWIEEWARWHVAMHGADAIVVFDNGSSRYARGDIEATLLAVPGIERVAVESWPYRYGMTDTALSIDPFYVLFLQVSSMSVALRRYAPSAAGLLNADVDELVMTPPGATIFDLARRTRQGLIVMRGRYIEPLALDGAPTAGLRHRHFGYLSTDARRAVSRPRKWALDPSRRWLRNFNVHPYMHWILGRPAFGKSSPAGVYYRHFRGINTNWKEMRADTTGIDRQQLALDEEWAALVAGDAF